MRKTLSESIRKFEVNEKVKSIALPNVVFELVGFGKDTNGNSVTKFKNRQGKGFSIQSNGTLPKCHALRGEKPKDLDTKQLQEIASEVSAYIKEHGTKTMREGLSESLYEGIKEKSLIKKAFESIGVDKPYDTKMAEAGFECGIDIRGSFDWQNGKKYYLAIEIRTYDFLGGSISLSEKDKDGRFTDNDDMQFDNLKALRKFLMQNKK